MKAAKFLRGFYDASYKHFVKHVGKCKRLDVPVTRNLTIATCRKSYSATAGGFYSPARRDDMRDGGIACMKYCTSSYPSHTKIPLPALSPTMETGTIVAWHKKEGDQVSEGTLMADIETDKATMGFEAPEDGYLAKILLPAGSKNVPVGKLMCLLVENEEDVVKFQDYKDTSKSASPSAPAPKPKVSPKPSETPPPPPSPVSSFTPPVPPPPPPPPPPPTTLPPSPASTSFSTAKLFMTPLARRIVQEKGLKLSDISIQSGPNLQSVLRVKDVATLQPKAAVAFTPPVTAAAAVDVSMDEVQQEQAQLYLQAKTVFHYKEYVLIENLLNFGGQLGAPQLTVHDFVLKAAALACAQVPEVNSSWLGTSIREYKTVDINVAIGTDRGLISPVIFGVEGKGLLAIHNELEQLRLHASEGTLHPSSLQVGTFSVSCMMNFGIRSFSAIIQPPQACILAVGCQTQTVLPDSSTEKGCDHRVVDGAVGAQWLSIFKTFLEKPSSMLL